MQIRLGYRLYAVDADAISLATVTPVLGDPRRAVALIKDDVAALGPQTHPDRISESVDAAQHPLARIRAEPYIPSSNDRTFSAGFATAAVPGSARPMTSHSVMIIGSSRSRGPRARQLSGTRDCNDLAFGSRISTLDRPARDLRRHRVAGGARLVHAGHDPPPALRVGLPVGQQKPDRAAGLLAEAGDPGELEWLVLEILFISLFMPKVPTPAAPSPAPIPDSSSISANRPGTISPWVVLCTLVRQVVKPKAPARTASSVRRHGAAASPVMPQSSGMESCRLLIQILLEARENVADLLGSAQVGNGIGDGVVILEPEQGVSFS